MKHHGHQVPEKGYKPPTKLYKLGCWVESCNVKTSRCHLLDLLDPCFECTVEVQKQETFAHLSKCDCENLSRIRDMSFFFVKLGA